MCAAPRGVTDAGFTSHVMLPVNPFMHLHANSSEVWSMGWSEEVLKNLGVTYDQLRSKGMNVE